VSNAAAQIASYAMDGDGIPLEPRSAAALYPMGMVKKMSIREALGSV